MFDKMKSLTTIDMVRYLVIFSDECTLVSSLTHSLIHSLTHSPTLLLTHLLIHSLYHSLTLSLTVSLTLSLTHSLTTLSRMQLFNWLHSLGYLMLTQDNYFYLLLF